MGIEKLNAMAEKVQKAKAEVMSAGQGAFLEACKDVFAAHPGLEYFSWNQYTPYFADGDPCIFSVNEYSLAVEFEGRRFGEEFYNDDTGEYEYNQSESESEKAAKAACKELVDFLERVPEIAEAAFGDHVTVTVRNADKEVRVDTEEHYHD